MSYFIFLLEPWMLYGLHIEQPPKVDSRRKSNFSALLLSKKRPNPRFKYSRPRRIPEPTQLETRIEELTPWESIQCSEGEGPDATPVRPIKLQQGAPCATLAE